MAKFCRVFLVELLSCGVLTLFFLFYFNRLFASLVSCGLRAWTWRRYGVYVHIQELQISLLGGRIFFKGVRYVGNNESIIIHNGSVTWRYWLRKCKGVTLNDTHGDFLESKKCTPLDREEKQSRNIENAEQANIQKPASLPCRLKIVLAGVEWFIYNRSAAYEVIFAGMHRDAEQSPPPQEKSQLKERRSRQDEVPARPEEINKSSSQTYTKHFGARSTTNFDNEAAGTHLDEAFYSPQDGAREENFGLSSDKNSASILNVLPIFLDCSKVAVVLGNQHTKSIMITKADRVSGEIDACRCPTIDKYRQLIDLKFEHPIVQMKPNEGYKGEAGRTEMDPGSHHSVRTKSASRNVRGHHRIHLQSRKWYHLRDIFYPNRNSTDSLPRVVTHEPDFATETSNYASWQGLSRYLVDAEQEYKPAWNAIEYAAISTIVDSPEAAVKYYWDVPGTVPLSSTDDMAADSDPSNVNGQTPPGWGAEIRLKGALVNYGPWADRQRADMLRVFFPGLCRDAVPTETLARGERRIPTQFKVYIELDNETALRIPIREESKNWSWAKRADNVEDRQKGATGTESMNWRRKPKKGHHRGETRPFGWLDVKLPSYSTLRYTMDMVAGPCGFTNVVDLCLPQAEITTSVNHGLLLKSISNRITCNLSNPLQWNGLRSWTFDVKSDGLEFFFLREHVFLLNDLIDDWASGPVAEYLTFSPFQYLLDVCLGDFRLYLNVNDSNIIDSPSDFDDNAFVVIFGRELRANILLPVQVLRPPQNTISFTIEAEHGGMKLCVPPWNTKATFLNSADLAQLEVLKIAGKYQFNETASATNTDTLLIDIYCEVLSAELYGFVIRYFLLIKDNYFGDDIRFKTLEEYQELLRMSQSERAQNRCITPHKQSSDLDVILSVIAHESIIIIPSNLYSALNSSRLTIAHFSADFRFTNYYMELDVSLSTLEMSHCNEEDDKGITDRSTARTQLFIDGLAVASHRLFGLPPTEPTYVCNWDFIMGDINGDFTVEFASRLVNSVKAFALSFNDDENALPSLLETALHDATFLRFALNSIDVCLYIRDSAFLASVGPISAVLSDLSETDYSQKLSLEVPDLCVSCVDVESALLHRSRPHHLVKTHALIQTALVMTVLTRSSAGERERKLQRAHIRHHDRRTKRVGFLALQELHDDIVDSPITLPAMDVPPMPVPIYEAEAIALRSVVLNHDLESGFVTHPQAPAPPYDLYLEHFMASHGSRASTDTVEDLQSKSPSHSLEGGLGILSNDPKPEHPASKGRQPSFGSRLGNRGVASPNMAFSSRYSSPYFPLSSVRPNKQHLPMPPMHLPKDARSKISLSDVNVKPVPDGSTHSSFVVQFPHGITGFLNQTAVLAAAELLNSLQPTSPADLLDILQIDAVKKIMGLKDRKRWSRQALDWRILASSINLRFLSAPADGGSPAVFMQNKAHDQYDFSSTGLDTVFSSEKILTSAEAAATHLHSMHFSLCSAVVSAKEKSNDICDSHAAIKLVVDDLILRLTTNEADSIGLTFNLFDLSIASTKITYLSSLLVRTQILADEFRQAFSAWSEAQLNRTRLLTYFLVTTGPQTADPLFITRPSYVLRAATNHLRTNDSWKLVTRLRHIYNSLSLASRREITARCFENTEIVPVDARQRFLASFNEWRGWDLVDVDSCFLIEKLYSSTTGDISSVRSLPRDLVFSLEVECVRVVLDRGPKQSEISIQRLTAMFHQQATKISDQSSSNPRISRRQNKVLQVLCGQFAVILNWEIYEVAESALKNFHHSRDTLVSSKAFPQQLRAGTLHLLVVIQAASVAIDTVNLRCHFAIRNGSISYVLDGDGSNSTDITCAVDAVNANAQSHGQDLASVDFCHSSICYSYRSKRVDGASAVLFKIASNCCGFFLNIQQDVLVLADTLNLFLKDEIAQIYQLIHIYKVKSTQSSKDRLSAYDPEKNHTFNVALFLDMYRITFPLLQSLDYSISGLGVRASITAQGKSDIVLDLDIKENSHELHNQVAGRVHNVFSFVVPTTNGRVVSQQTSHETRLGLFVLVEPISLDASALHNLLFALGRPEISSMLSDAREVANSTKERAKEIFSEQPMPLPEAGDLQNTVVYDAHLTIAGFDVFANAKGSPEFEITKVSFNLGCLKLMSTNHLDQDTKILAFPESRLTLRHVDFHILRGNGNVMRSCGSLTFDAVVTTTTKLNDTGQEVPLFLLSSSALAIELFAETASSVVDVLAHLQTKIKDVDLSRDFVYLHKLRGRRPYVALEGGELVSSSPRTPLLLHVMYSLELLDVQIRWFVAANDDTRASYSEYEDLVFSLKRINLSTRKPNFARLKIEDLQLQMVPTSEELGHRTLNSAFLPEIIFNVGYVTTAEARRLAFQAAGKSLDLRLTSHCIIPAAMLQKSISSAVAKVRSVSRKLAAAAIDVSSDGSRPLQLFGKKRLESLLVDADFAGAVVHLSGAMPSPVNTKLSGYSTTKHAQGGKYEQSPHNDISHSVILRAPGLAWKVEYRDNGAAEPSFVAEVKVDASSNILYPAVVPLILEITSTIKDIVSHSDQKEERTGIKTSQQSFMSLDDDNILTADPSAVLGRTRLNLGLRICRQEFSLSCQPISRVAVTARFSDIYMTINNVRSPEHGHFLAVSSAFSGLEASIQHVYSRESTGSFGIDSVFLSLMNSKHLNGVSGISAILRISPMMVLINGKQLQDFLLFREIWMPRELQSVSMAPIHSKISQPQMFLVQRYQQVAATGAFPWNATVSIAELDIRLDLGQTIGKPAFIINNFWISSKKSSDWEQNLCLGFDDVRIDSTGRASGLITLQQVSIRTSIHWPGHEVVNSQTPFIQGCLSFDRLQMKAAFDYQSFVVADISFFHFLMYNVRNGPNDRLVAVLHGEAAQIFCTTATASQALALYQAFERLIQEKQSNYETSLQEIDKFLNRDPSSQVRRLLTKKSSEITNNSKVSKSPISLHTDVVFSLKTVNIGAFPTTFADHQVFKLEALDSQARFSVAMNNEKIHSILSFTLGQLRIGLAGVKNLDLPKAVGELSIGDVVINATSSRGGTILKVPKVEATMETWQSTASNHIDYVFKSSFEGKVEIGWNYSRIAYIRNMWASHTKTLAQRLGKPLPQSAVKITGVLDEDGGQSTKHDSKITAEVNVPQSKYQYTALQPPIIETPQLREMGEATPPLEWIGLHRDKLPNLTHQILIVPLLELASEVEDAYAKILGSS